MGSSQDDPYQRDVGSPGHGWGRVPPSPVGTPGPGPVSARFFLMYISITRIVERLTFIIKNHSLDMVAIHAIFTHG